MHDQIYVKDYRKEVEVGAFWEERAKRQQLNFTVVVNLQNQSSPTDNVDEILSYDVIVEAIDGVLAEKRYNLLETMAEEIAARILVAPSALSVLVEIEKLGRIDGRLGVRINRSAKIGSGRILSGKDESSVVPSPPWLFIWDDTIVPQKAESVAVILPPAPFSSGGLYRQRQYILCEDARLWELAEKLNLPVIDSKVEAEAYISRKENFIRAYGKQPFDLLPPLVDYSADAIIAWHLQQLGARLIEAEPS